MAKDKKASPALKDHTNLKSPPRSLPLKRSGLTFVTANRPAPPKGFLSEKPPRAKAARSPEKDGGPDFWKKRFTAALAEKLALEKELARRNAKISELAQKLSGGRAEEAARLKKENRKLARAAERLATESATEANHAATLQNALTAALAGVGRFESAERAAEEFRRKAESLEDSVAEFDILYRVLGASFQRFGSFLSNSVIPSKITEFCGVSGSGKSRVQYPIEQSFGNKLI